MSPVRIHIQPTFVILADGTGYWVRRQGRRICVCVDIPEDGKPLARNRLADLRARFWRAWRHARIKEWSK